MIEETSKIEFTESTGNVFADMNLEDAEVSYKALKKSASKVRLSSVKPLFI